MVELVEKLSDFKNIIDTNSYVAVDFFASWCGPCKALAPKFNELAKSDTWKNVVFCKVDCSNESEIGDAYAVASLPTILFYKNGKAKYKVVGNDKDAVVQALTKLTNDN
jgi:thioredoxin 1